MCRSMGNGRVRRDRLGCAQLPPRAPSGTRAMRLGANLYAPSWAQHAALTTGAGGVGGVGEGEILDLEDLVVARALGVDGHPDVVGLAAGLHRRQRLLAALGVEAG